MELIIGIVVSVLLWLLRPEPVRRKAAQLVSRLREWWAGLQVKPTKPSPGGVVITPLPAHLAMPGYAPAVSVSSMPKPTCLYSGSDTVLFEAYRRNQAAALAAGYENLGSPRVLLDNPHS